MIVDLWHAAASVGRPGPTERYCERLLTPEDRKRADRFRRETTRNQHVIGRGMARRVVARGGISPHSLTYDDHVEGKPRFRCPRTASMLTDFNVSHTEGLVVCGRLRRSEATPPKPSPMIGVDVEPANRRVDLDLAQRYFAEPEIAHVRGQPDEAQGRAAFLKIWTLKESFIKAIGTGMRTPLDAFSFFDIDSERPSIDYLDDSLGDRIDDQRTIFATDWHFRCLAPRPGFVAAIAVHGSRRRWEPNADALRLRLKNFDRLAQLATRWGVTVADAAPEATREQPDDLR